MYHCQPIPALLVNNFISFPSSVHPNYMMTIAGIGFIIVVCSLAMVNIIIKDLNVTQHVYSPVMYRSKDSTFPDFSKSNDAVGEIFFDVRSIFHHTTSVPVPNLYLSRMPFRTMELSPSLPSVSQNVGNILRMGSLFQSVPVFIILH